MDCLERLVIEMTHSVCGLRRDNKLCSGLLIRACN